MESNEGGTQPVDFGQLLDALDGVGQAVGFAMAGALSTKGLDVRELTGIARSLQTMNEHDRFPGPAGHCMGGIVFGLLAYANAQKRGPDEPLLMY